MSLLELVRWVELAGYAVALVAMPAVLYIRRDRINTTGWLAAALWFIYASGIDAILADLESGRNLDQRDILRFLSIVCAVVFLVRALPWTHRDRPQGDLDGGAGWDREGDMKGKRNGILNRRRTTR